MNDLFSLSRRTPEVRKHGPLNLSVVYSARLMETAVGRPSCHNQYLDDMIRNRILANPRQVRGPCWTRDAL